MRSRRQGYGEGPQLYSRQTDSACTIIISLPAGEQEGQSLILVSGLGLCALQDSGERYICVLLNERLWTELFARKYESPIMLFSSVGLSASAFLGQ